MDKTELETRMKEIEVKIKNLYTWAYADGHEAGIGIGMKNQDAEGYNKGLEDMWDVWHWYSHSSASDVYNLFPEVLKKGYTYYVDVVGGIGLAEAVRRIKKDKESDARILYSTISDLKSDYTKDQIIKALKDNGIEVIEVEHDS